MKYYPVNLYIYNKKVIIVGGGLVATRKIERLVERGAKISIISPEITGKIKKFIDNGQIHEWIERTYKQGDEKGAFAVFCAISSNQENKKIEEILYDRCIKKNILINIADKPEYCTFTLPALVSRGDFDIAIFTSGMSPKLAKKIREDLEKVYGEEYTIFVRLLGLMRKEIKMKNLPQSENKKIFSKLIDSELLDLVRQRKYNEISRFLSNFIRRNCAVTHYDS
jgi:precorrin-2 dehydrogenase/sirohydrochlorin ferrochelatase